MSNLYDRAAVISSHEDCGQGMHLLVMRVPDIPERLSPGQFVHVKIPGMEGHILRRPFSVFWTNPAQSQLALLYQCVGYGTKHLASLVEGNELMVMGPLGNGWQLPEKSQQNVLLVGGGVGAAPLYMYAQKLIEQGFAVKVVLGARTKQALSTYHAYQKILPPDALLVATDDGSFGHAGFCTDLVQAELAAHWPQVVACCGPEPMMKLVSSLTLAQDIPTFISLEKRMACGIGACLSCVVMTSQGNKRSCVDGPVFDAAKVVW